MQQESEREGESKAKVQSSLLTKSSVVVLPCLQLLWHSSGCSQRFILHVIAKLFSYLLINMSHFSKPFASVAYRIV